MTECLLEAVGHLFKVGILAVFLMRKSKLLISFILNQNVYFPHWFTYSKFLANAYTSLLINRYNLPRISNLSNWNTTKSSETESLCFPEGIHVSFKRISIKPQNATLTFFFHLLRQRCTELLEPAEASITLKESCRNFTKKQIFDLNINLDFFCLQSVYFTSFLSFSK